MKQPYDAIVKQAFTDYIGVAPMSAILAYIDDYLIVTWKHFGWVTVENPTPSLYKAASAVSRHIDIHGIEHRYDATNAKWIAYIRQEQI
jgi:hypothetical protein